MYRFLEEHLGDDWYDYFNVDDHFYLMLYSKCRLR